MKQIKNAMMLVVGGMVMLFTISSCDKSDDPLPTIDGYNNSNEVASSNLKAHWTFDDTRNEAISNTSPVAFGTVGYTTGQIGNAINLTAGALVYPPIANINTADALANYTVSMWLKTDNTGNTFSTYFAIVPSAITDLWGAIDMSAETGWFAAKPGVVDTLVLKTNYGSLKPDGSLDGQDNRPDPKGTPPVGVFLGTGKWIHFVARWDATSHKLQVFGNGVSIGAYDLRAGSGPLVLKTPAQAVVGSLPHNDIGFAGITGTRGDWMPWATAAIDDIRVFNTAIADKDITALFNLGTAGR